MSDVLALAMYKARMAKQTPQVVNIWRGSGKLEQEIKAAKAHIDELQKQNAELRGQVGGLTTRINQLTSGADQPASVEYQLTKEPAPVFLKISEIAHETSREFRIAVIDMQSERRTRDAVIARQVAMYLARRLTNRAFPAISGYFGKRDHTTAMHAYRKIGELRKNDQVLDSMIKRIECRLFAFDTEKNAVSDAMVSLKIGEPLRENAPVSGFQSARPQSER